MNEILGNNIMLLRKENGLTQEQLANALGISYQAVSKWETGNSCPDISTLPLLADLFSVSVDQLIGRVPLMSAPEERQSEQEERTVQADPRPWMDDDTFYAVLYHGHSLVGYLAGDRDLSEAKKHFVFQYEGPAQNIHSDFSVEMDGRVAGNVDAGGNVSCGDVDGDVISGGNASCGDVDGDVRANGSVNCGDVDGSVNAGGNVDCGDVDGDVRAGGSVRCGDVGGSVSAGSSVSCDDVGGDVQAGIRVNCDSVSGSVSSGFGATRGADGVKLDDLDDMIDEQVEKSVQFSMNMSDFGEELGQRISNAVQKAFSWNGFRSKNHKEQEDNER